jgi:hypothetical protein
MVQGRDGLRGDSWVAAAGVGDADAEAQATETILRGDVSQRRPGFVVGVNPGNELGCSDMGRVVDRPRQKRVEVIRHPQGVDAARESGQVTGPHQRVRPETGFDDVVVEPYAYARHTPVAFNLVVRRC